MSDTISGLNSSYLNGTYTDGGAEAKDLVQGSFRAFLARELNRDTPGGNSCTWR